MNFSTLIGFLAAFAVFAASVALSFQNTWVIFDLHAGLMVIGGTVAAGLICFPLKQIAALLRVFFRRMIGHHRRDYMAIIRDIVMLSDAKLKGKKSFDQAIGKVEDPFLQDAARVLFWLQADVRPEELRDLLETRVRTHFNVYMNEAKTFKTLSKFPPAFGLMGTTMGMIALLQSLGTADAKNMIGPAMAIALVATLYGLVLTNFIFIPISENLAKQTQEDAVCRSIVVEGIMLIQADRPTKFIEEKVKSYLLPSARGGGNQAA